MPEFRIYLLEECLINPPPEPEAEGPKAAGLGAALLALFLPKLIETAISGLANLLRKAGEDETDQLTAFEFADLYVADKQQALALNPKLGCLLAVWFEDRDKKSPPDDEIARRLKAEKLVPEGKALGGVFEALVRPTLDGTAFFLDTRHFSAREFIGDRRKDERAYVVTLSLSTPDATAEGSTFALGAINLGKLKKGDSLVSQGHPLDEFPRFRSNLMPWSKISEAAQEAYERDVGAEQAAGRSYMPVTFSLTVSETADGSEFLLKLGEMLGGLAEKAAEQIGKRVLPAEIEKAKAEKAADAEQLYEDELKALLEVRKAEKAYAEAAEADKPVRKVELELAIRKYEWQTALRRAAGLPDRPDVDSE